MSVFVIHCEWPFSVLSEKCTAGRKLGGSSLEIIKIFGNGKTLSKLHDRHQKRKSIELTKYIANVVLKPSAFLPLIPKRLDFTY